jgi:hypothetical protein
MGRFRFPIAVALTSLALVVTLFVVGGLIAGSALARGAWGGGYGFAPWAVAHGVGGWSGGGWNRGFALPPELAGLRDVPPAERFAHFKGVQVSLTDQDNRPVTVDITPGMATTASATSLAITANDGSTKTYTLDDTTLIHGRSARDGNAANQPTIGQGDQVVVVTINGSSTARGVMLLGANGLGMQGPFGH